jgi:lipopolysaccharide transport system permease protein
MDPDTSDIDRPEPAPVQIEPPRKWAPVNVAELWAYRELLYFLTWREVKVRYKQTAIGAAWAVLQPLLTMLVFTVVFGLLIQVPSDGIPYPVFAYSALVPWNFFTGALTRASGSLVADAPLLSKIYFPRLLLPLAAVASASLDFAMAFVLLAAMIVWYGLTLGPALLLLPVFVLLAVLTALACGLWLSALNVKYRDVVYVIPFLMQVWLFLTPVAYPSSLVPERWKALYGLNPMAGVVEGFRWALLGTAPPRGAMVAASMIVVGILLVGGALYFRRVEHEFADVV